MVVGLEVVAMVKVVVLVVENELLVEGMAIQAVVRRPLVVEMEKELLGVAVILVVVKLLEVEEKG